MPNAYTSRHAVDAQGNHGYEIGTVDPDKITDPAAFHAVEFVYDQLEAFKRTAWWNANPPDHLPPDESGEGSERESKPKTRGR